MRTPDHVGPPITYRNSFPNYGLHSMADVDILMTGNNDTEFASADTAMQARIRGWERPPEQTGHHNEEGVTMQLVPGSVHARGGGAASPYIGGASLSRKSQRDGV